VSKFCATGWGDSPRTRASKRGTPLRNRYFTTISSSSVKTVADRHRLAAYHSKHCRRAFQGYQHRWPWTPKISVFSEFFAISGCNTSEFSPKLLEMYHELLLPLLLLLSGLVVSAFGIWARAPGSILGRAIIPLGSNLGQVVYSHCLPSFSAPRNWGSTGSFRRLGCYGD